MTHTVPNIQATAHHDVSVTRLLSDKVLAEIGANETNAQNLVDVLPLLDGEWLGANFAPVDDRTDAHRENLALSGSLVEEIQRADTRAIGSPIYNFSFPAVLKAWIDLIAHVGVTLKYSPNGPSGYCPANLRLSPWLPVARSLAAIWTTLQAISNPSWVSPEYPTQPL